MEISFMLHVLIYYYLFKALTNRNETVQANNKQTYNKVLFFPSTLPMGTEWEQLKLMMSKLPQKNAMIFFV